MSFRRLINDLIESRRLNKALQARKVERKARQDAALRGKVTEHKRRIARHRQTWGIEA